MPEWRAVFLSHANGGPHRLRELLTDASPILAPGAFDCFSARLIEAAGFPAVYMTGFGTAASHLGRPDVGLLGMSEMVDQARRIVASVQVPVIADADTGYGNPINVVRTIKAYEDAGVAAVHLEDQVAPKRCGHMAGKQVIAPSDMLAKIEAAVAARRSADFTIIARTDARAVEGLDRALERAWQYKDAGADVIFVEALESVEEVERVAEAFRSIPLLFNWAEGGRTPPIAYSRLRELGFRIVIFPIGPLLVAGRAIRDLLETLKRDGTPAAAMDRMMGFQDVIDFLGAPEIRALEERFAEKSRKSAESS
jgi:carboxyvinyl-carboxyphosphonate phosphorylmutase